MAMAMAMMEMAIMLPDFISGAKEVPALRVPATATAVVIVAGIHRHPPPACRFIEDDDV